MIKKAMKSVKPAIGLVAGAVAAKVVANKVIPASLPSIARKAAPVVLGIVLMGMKGEFIKNIGAGMVASAGADLAAEYVPGIGALSEEDLSGIFEEISPINDGEEISEEVNPMNDFVGDNSGETYN